MLLLIHNIVNTPLTSDSTQQSASISRSTDVADVGIIKIRPRPGLGQHTSNTPHTAPPPEPDTYKDERKNAITYMCAQIIVRH